MAPAGTHRLGIEIYQAASVFLGAGALAKAEALFRRYVEIAKDQPADEIFITAIQNIGVCRKKAGDYEEAARWYDRALKLSRDIGFLRGQADNISNIAILRKNEGRSHLLAGRTREALESFSLAAALYSEAKELDRRTGNEAAIGIDLLNLGILYTHMQSRSKAKGALLECIDLATRLGDETLLGKAELAMGRLYQNISRLDEAVSWLERSARTLSVGPLDASSLAQSLGNLGAIHLERSDFKRSRECLEAARRLYDMLDWQSPEGKECEEALKELDRRCRG